MTTNGTDQFFEAWKKQVDASVRVMDAVVEATAKMRSMQLSAANEEREHAQTLAKALADAKNAQELWGAQWNWALASCERSAAYWRALFEAMNEANAKLARCAQDGAQAAVPAEGAGGLPSTGLPAVDNVYREMLKVSQQLLQYSAGAMVGRAAEPGAAGKTKAHKAA